MAVSTYAELQTAISSWFPRSGDTDFSSQITTFIALCEERINRELRVRGMEDRITGSVSSEFIALPTDFLEMRLFQLNTDPVTKLVYVSPEWLAETYASSITGEPKVFTILNDEIQLGPAPDATYTAEMVYWKKLPALSASQTTNWLLTNHPGVYLWGSLAEAALFNHDFDKFALFDKRYQDALAAVQKADERGKWSGSLLAARPIGITVA